MHTRTGISLTELIISISIFSAALVTVLESSIGIISATRQHEDLLDLEREGREIIDHLTHELSNSAWFSLGGGQFYPQAGPTSPSTFGNTLDFPRIDHGKTDTTSTFDFRQAFTPMSGWKTPESAIPGLVANEQFLNNGLGRLVNPVWHPIEAKADKPLSFEENASLESIKLFRYIVRPNQVGRGSLWRFIRQEVDAPWSVDQTFSPIGRDIFALRITPILYSQRIHIYLELRRESPGASRATRTFSTVVAMRSAY